MKNLLYFTLLSVAITLFPQLTSATEKTAYFGGGCFWCTEADFAKIEGVRDVVSGYMGGHVVNPAYKDVSKGTTGHYEIVKVVIINREPTDLDGYADLILNDEISEVFGSLTEKN